MANPGDSVKIKTSKEELEGILIQTPELLGDDIILKLKNGYNIGINRKDVKSIRVIKKKGTVSERKQSLKRNPKLPTVAILSTGGTISSKVDYTTGGVVAEYTAEDFVAMAPELSEIANIKAKKIMEVMSEDMNIDHWKEIAKAVEKEMKNVDGVVLTMGTDTLGYTAAALSFMLKINKPLIITAAQRSIDRGSSDAFFNLISAVNAAANWEGAEVVSCMHGTSSDEYCNLIRGTKVRKMSSSRRDAFQSINEKPLARVYGKEKIEKLNDYKKRSKEKIEVNTNFEKKVALVYVYPGMDEKILDNYLNYKGIILMGTGFGHVPLNIINAVKKLINKGVFVGMTTQCINGRTSSKVYSPLRRLSIEMGVVYLEDMLPETAYVKLGWVLGNEKKVKELMVTNIAGEINPRIEFENEKGN